jgi:short-subunit dehydrogenase
MKFNNFMSLTEDELMEMFDVNVRSVLIVTQIVLKKMLKQNSGHIMNISSIRGISGCPNKSGYAASKFALQGLTDSLRLELKDTPIKITNICPGKVGQSVLPTDVMLTVRYILSLSDITFIRNIILGGQL